MKALTVKDGNEHGVSFYKDSEGMFHYTNPVTSGRVDSVDIGKAFSQVPGGVDNVTGLMHSHNVLYRQPWYLAEDFSLGDRQNASAKFNSFKRDFNTYILTPRGNIQFWNPRVGGPSQTVGTVE